MKNFIKEKRYERKGVFVLGSVFCVFLSLNVCSQPAERLTKEKQLNLPEGVSSNWWATVSKQIKE